jgi:thymidylate synthase ThyX
MPQRPLTKAEKRRLAPFVTDLEGPVFVLTHLPEVVKGALFSRYSRSALGVRELLLKEFLPGVEDENEADAAGAPVSVARAQDFYDRILDGYGDDSIGELGGAHVAIEDVSMIATKILEDARIGGSPLEKSTRYVSFADKVDGEYRFYREPRLMSSRHRETYLAACRGLFETYAGSIEPMCAYLERVVPREPGASEAAWRRALRARAYDALRGLLPAATLTNMGIFGNGRFFEALLIRLRLAGLAETERIAEAMQRELGKVIPSFIRRADPKHPHFAAFHEFGQGLREAVRALAAQVSSANGAPDSGSVTPPGEVARLIDFDPDAETRFLAALAFPAAEAPLPVLREWAARLTESERAAIFGELAELRGNRRHKLPRALEAVRYTFDLVGDFGIYRDLHRHRMLTQERQPLSTRLGYSTPEEIETAGLRERYDAAMEEAAKAYEAIAPDFPAEAQYVIPLAYRIRWFAELSLRELMWLVELRSAPQGHPAYRRMAQGLFRAVEAVHPRLATLIRFVDLGAYALGRLGAEERQERKQAAQSI